MMLDEFPHPPGTDTVRQFMGYSPYQEALWQAFSDTYYSRAYGFSETRMPTPGLEFDEERYLAWQQKVVYSWSCEAGRDANTRGLTKEDLPEPLWLYLFERMVDAGKLKPKNGS